MIQCEETRRAGREAKKESDKGNAATDHTTTAAGKRKGSPERGHPKSAKHDSRTRKNITKDYHV